MKINNKLNKYLLVGIMATALVSCEYEYDQEYPPANKPVASISPLNVTAAEGETVTFTVTLNEAINYVSNFKLETEEAQSSAVESEDFVPVLPIYPEFDFGQQGYKVDLPPLATTFTFDVVIPEDILADNSEVAVLSFVAAGDGHAAVQNTRQEVTLNITNTETFNGATSSDLGVKLDWSGMASFPITETDPDTGETTRVLVQDFDLCGLDFDVLIQDPNGTATYLAGTANCPEIGVLSAGAPDGTYTLFVDYYDDGGQETVIAPVAVPLTLTVANIGTADGSTTYPELFDISTPVSVDEGGTPVAIATIEKSSSNYTVTNLITGQVFYP